MDQDLAGAPQPATPAGTIAEAAQADAAAADAADEGAAAGGSGGDVPPPAKKPRKQRDPNAAYTNEQYSRKVRELPEKLLSTIEALNARAPPGEAERRPYVSCSIVLVADVVQPTAMGPLLQQREMYIASPHIARGDTRPEHANIQMLYKARVGLYHAERHQYAALMHGDEQVEGAPAPLQQQQQGPVLAVRTNMGKADLAIVRKLLPQHCNDEWGLTGALMHTPCVVIVRASKLPRCLLPPCEQVKIEANKCTRNLTISRRTSPSPLCGLCMPGRISYSVQQT